MSNQEKLYLRGFNSGYVLAKHMPILLAQIVKTIHPSEGFTKGFLSGKKEYELERSRIQIDELSHLRSKSQNRDKGLGRE